jgi:hypothetical protein
MGKTDKIKLPGRKATLKRKPIKMGSDVVAREEPARTPSIDPQLVTAPAIFHPPEPKYDPPPAHQGSAPDYEYLGELPDCYGTKRLFLVSRDPHWLFAYWDMGWHQYWDAQRAAHDGKVFLQVYYKDGTRAQQLQINEAARNWYIHVGQPDTAYYAELGYYRQDGHFEVISRSGEAVTPRDNLSWKSEVRFVTVPFDYTFRRLWEIILGHTRDGEELAEALCRLQEEGFPFPFPVGRGRRLSRRKTDQLLDYLGEEYIRRIRVGSLEITETLRRRFHELLSSGQWMTSITSLSSPVGGFGRSFDMHVNAELIIYGGTDPKAKMRIDGQEITLREDGTFSYHFNFPDGKYHIPIEATSPDGQEIRSALLSFLRVSDFAGEVRATPQTPRPEPIGRDESDDGS